LDSVTEKLEETKLSGTLASVPGVNEMFTSIPKFAATFDAYTNARSRSCVELDLIFTHCHLNDFLATQQGEMLQVFEFQSVHDRTPATMVME